MARAAASGAAGLVVLALAAGAAFSAPAPVTKGLTFALSFDRDGRAITSGPFVLRVPGAKKSLKVVFDSVALSGGMLDAPIRLLNESGTDLFAVRIDLVGVTESVKPQGRAAFSRDQDVAPPPPLAFDAIRSGSGTPADLFRGGPIHFSSDTEVVVILGVVSGLAVAAADPVRDVLTPATKASACPGQPRGCRRDADGNVWRLEPAAEGRRGGLSERGPEGGVVRSLRFEEGAKPVDLALAPDGRLLVFFDDGSSGGAVRAFRPF